MKEKGEVVSDVSKLFRRLNIVPGDEVLVPKFGNQFEYWFDVESSAECRPAIVSSLVEN